MKKIILLLLSFIFFDSCGLPDASTFQELQAPVLIDDGTYPKCTINGGNASITLELMVYNPEIDFSGYNVYLSTNPVDILTLQNQLIGIAASHVYSNNGINQFDKNIEDQSIIESTHNTIPTLQKGDVANVDGTNPSTYNLFPTYITVTVSNYPHGVNGGGAFPTNTSFGFGVTSTSLPNTTESVLSNVMIVNSGNTNGYCSVSYNFTHITNPLQFFKNFPSKQYKH